MKEVTIRKREAFSMYAGEVAHSSNKGWELIYCEGLILMPHFASRGEYRRQSDLDELNQVQPRLCIIFHVPKVLDVESFSGDAEMLSQGTGFCEQLRELARYTRGKIIFCVLNLQFTHLHKC